MLSHGALTIAVAQDADILLRDRREWSRFLFSRSDPQARNRWMEGVWRARADIRRSALANLGRGYVIRCVSSAFAKVKGWPTPVDHSGQRSMKKSQTRSAKGFESVKVPLEPPLTRTRSIASFVPAAERESYSATVVGMIALSAPSRSSRLRRRVFLSAEYRSEMDAGSRDSARLVASRVVVS